MMMTKTLLSLVAALALLAAAVPGARAQAASAVPLKPQAVGAACQESSVCASGFCIDGVCADVLTACKATAKSGGKACPKFSGQAFKPTPMTSPACAATALALKLPSAASATNACYKAGEGEICVVSTPKKKGEPAKYGVVCNGLATADAAAAAEAKATTPAPPAGNGAEAASARGAVVVAGLAGLAAVAVLL